MKHSFEIAFFYLWRAENDNMLKNEMGTKSDYISKSIQ